MKSELNKVREYQKESKIENAGSKIQDHDTRCGSLRNGCVTLSRLIDVTDFVSQRFL